jgi:sugar/nucleoside kinase (ribokinase family)
MLDVHAVSGDLAHGGDVHGRVLVHPGGTSGNAAVWAAWAGARAGVVGSVGDDLAGSLLVRELSGRAVDVDGIRRDAAPTGVMLVVTESGDRSMVADRGANARLSADAIPDPLEAGAVLVSGYLLLQEPGHDVAVAVLARTRATWLGVEAASWPLVERFGVDRYFDVTSDANVIFANDREAKTLTGSTGADAARALGERYRAAAVKLGAAGAVLCLDGEVIEAPAAPITEVDPTGAGDAFDGVLLARMVGGDEPAEALRMACRAGGLVAASRETWPEPGVTP